MILMSIEPETPDVVEPVSGTAHDDDVHATEQRMASEIYGLIVASSVLAAGSDDEDIAHVALSVLVTLVVYWLAEAYAHTIAAHHVRGGRSRLFHELRSGWPLVSASFLPLLTVLLAAVFGASVSVAQTVGMICATALLGASGWIAAGRNGLSGLTRFGLSLLAAGLGVILIVLKSVLH
jgi:hypothetical protein